VENIGSDLKPFLRHPPVMDMIEEDDKTLHFLLIAALHHGGNWCFWLKQVQQSPEALRRVLELLAISYFRPRLRAIYALRFFKQEDLLSLLDNGHVQLQKDLRKIIDRYVLSGEPLNYLIQLQNTLEPNMARKVGDVLREIGQYCDGQGEDSSNSGLPVV